MNKQYWKKVTLDALSKAVQIRGQFELPWYETRMPGDGFDTTDMYDWIDELNLRIKEVHKFRLSQLTETESEGKKKL